jgi:hypothetical protein
VLRAHGGGRAADGAHDAAGPSAGTVTLNWWLTVGAGCGVANEPQAVAVCDAPVLREMSCLFE